MIIHRVQAQNVLKYASLSIELGDDSLIAITGANESGKSSIGETVCFALFGRTFSLAPERIGKIVRWGENHCNVELDFSVEDGRYLLSRFLDRDGNHSARLSRAGTAEDPVALGCNAVAETLHCLLGYHFEQFTESFYLAQREITTRHHHGEVVRAMAGVAPMEHVKLGLQGEIDERDDLLGELAAEWEAADADVKGLGIEPGRMAGLEERQQQALRRLEEVRAVDVEIGIGVSRLEEDLGIIGRAGSAIGRNRWGRVFAGLLALALGSLWALLVHGGELLDIESLQASLRDHLPIGESGPARWIGGAALMLAGLFVVLWIRIIVLRRRVTRHRASAPALAATLARAREIEVVPVDPGFEGPRYDGPDADQSSPLRPEKAEFDAICRGLARNDVTLPSITEFANRERRWLAATAESLAHLVRWLDSEVDAEQARLQEAMDLSDVLNDLTDKREEVTEWIAQRQRAIELLDGAMRHLCTTFNRDVRGIVGRLLPLFTDGRYEHVQMDDGLNVRVFSNAKRDFMELDEVSTGTQRQVMLALRMALSRKLLGRMVRGSQFVLLDEPFAFFDEERMARSLGALADLRSEFKQVWIVTQRLPEQCAVAFDRLIHCDRATDTLTSES